MIKKILAWALTLALAVSVCPTTIFAADTVGTEIIRYQSMTGLPDEEKYTNGTWSNSLTTGSYSEGNAPANTPGNTWTVPDEADRANVRKVVLSNIGNSATWTIDFTGKTVGWYKVSVYLSTKIGYNIGMNVGAEITHAGDTEQTQGQITRTDGTQGWIDLGDYNFDGLGNEKIKIYNPDGNRIDLVAIKLTGVAEPAPSAIELIKYGRYTGSIENNGTYVTEGVPVSTELSSWTIPDGTTRPEITRDSLNVANKKATWTPAITTAGWYKVSVFFSTYSGYSRSTGGTVTVNAATTGSEFVAITAFDGTQGWIEVPGVYKFNAGTAGTIEVKNTGTDLGTGANLELMGLKLTSTDAPPPGPVILPDISDIPADVFASLQVGDAFAYLTDDNCIRMGGISPFGADTTVTAMVTIDSVLKYMDAVQTSSDGSVDISLSLDPMTDSSGTYIVSLGGGFLVKDDSLNVVFANKTDSDRILASVAGSNTSTIQGILASEQTLVDLDTAGDIMALSDAAAVYDSLAGKDFDSVQELRHAFDTAVAIQTLNESVPADGATLLNTYKDDLGVNLASGSLYSKIKTSALKNTIYNKICGQNISLTKADFTKAYEKAVYTAIINGIDTEDRDTLISYLEACRQKGYISFSYSTYNTFTDTEKSEVVKKIIEARKLAAFATLEAAKTAFNNAVTAVNNDKTKDDDDDGYSSSNNVTIGGFGGGGGGGFTPVAPQPGQGGASGSVFNDIATVPWAHTAIAYLSNKGVIAGVGNGSFEPDRAVTREEFVKMLMAALTMPAGTTTNTFNDVNPGDWYYDTVMQAYALGIINGVDFDIFGVGQPITREQLCTIVYRAMMLLDVEISVNDINVNISDRSLISDFAVAAVESMYRAQIVNGMGDGTFAPGNIATRAQAAKIIYQLLERMQLL